ncbi:glycosyltransferase [Ensifer sp.]|uniref:glycosyltransferase n=1 Tax=Ensifer sp. TaxID=1872086 RepID=UPI00289F4B20|nr:glycosyltransferase [Ensifer sp.]
MKRKLGWFARVVQRVRPSARVLFDPDFYLRMNGDVRLSGIEPWYHYRRHGFKEGRKPNYIFDPSWYLARYPDVKASGVEPLLHYFAHGFGEGRDPGPKFSTSAYLSMYPDVAAAHVNPLLHYLNYGRSEGRATVLAGAALNCSAGGTRMNGEPNANSVDEHYAIASSGFFDREYYLSRYPEVAASGLDPVTHFCTQGWREGCWPNPDFDVSYYLENNRDVAALGLNPLLHWIDHGRGEGRKVGAVQLRLDDTDPNGNPTVIFLSHESSRTGAPRVLLNLIEWVSVNTSIPFRIVIGSRGPWSDRFEALGECFHMDADHGISFDRKLREFCGDRVGLIYANTIAAGHYIHHLDFLDAEVLTHVHEMENLFLLYEDSFRALKERSSRFIAVSEGSTTALRDRGVPTRFIDYLPPFVTPQSPTEIGERLSGHRIIFGCGTAENRKGFDIFCEVGAALKRSASLNFRMYWIGAASESMPDPELEIIKRGVSDVVTWLGPKDAPVDYFRQGHVFLLPSREDPFPLVCLEAAQLGLPVVCFDYRAGGMCTFVEKDAGAVIDYLDVEQMAAKVRDLLNDDSYRAALGMRAKEKAHSDYSVDKAGRHIVGHFPEFTLNPDATWLDVALRRIDRSQIVSFDIFDTLITRRLNQPDIVFDLLEFRHTHREAAPIKLFSERMDTAGRVLMAFGGSRDDVDIDQIYAEMAFFRNSEIEKDLEISVSVAHPTALSLYRYALEKRKKIFIASDMYLDAATIETILRRNGFTHWDQLFLSSVLGKKKESGRMYDLLKERAEEFGVAPNNILHFGDNRHSDVDMARRAGLKASHFPALYEERVSAVDPHVDVSNLSQIGRLWGSFSEQSLKLWRKTPTGSSATFLTRLGFEVSGPLAAMMALFVKQTADEVGASNIVFMARDGRIMKDAFDELFKDDIASSKYVSRYLHLSRATVVPATFERQLSSNDVYFLLEGLHLGAMPLSYYLVKAGLDPSDRHVVSKVKKHFIGTEFVPDWSHLSIAAKLIRSLSEEIFLAASQKRDLLKGYLEQNGLLEPGKFLIVDVGWLLNIQSRLESFINKIDRNVTVLGCYVGSRDRVSKSVKHRALLFDCGDPSYYAKFVEANTTLFELLFSAPEPPADRLERTESGQVEPVLKKLTSPLPTEFSTALELQFGARAYFEYISGAFSDFLPQQVSRDYFFALFKGLVQTRTPLAHVMLNGVEVKLGGHHELRQIQNLLPERLNVEYTISPRDEYFEPKVLYGDPNRRVVVITSAGLGNASTRYRALWFAESMNKVGYETVVIHASTPLEKAQHFITRACVVVFQRCFEAQGNVESFYRVARGASLPCIGEMDDLILPDQIAIVGSVKGGEWKVDEAEFVARSYDNFMRKMDGFVVSTPALKSVFESRYAKKAVVYRNKVPATYVSEPERSFDELRMVYASGTLSHKADFSIIENSLYQFLKERPGTKLTLLGAVQSSDRLLSLKNVHSLPLLRYDAMMSELKKHNILLVPLEQTTFNECKSSVKFVEAGSVSMAVLASKVAEFDMAVDNCRSGFIAVTDEDWYEVLSRLADDPSILRKIGGAARTSVVTSFTTDFIESEVREFFDCLGRADE